MIELTFEPNQMSAMKLKFSFPCLEFVLTKIAERYRRKECLSFCFCCNLLCYMIMIFIITQSFIISIEGFFLPEITVFESFFFPVINDV